jgi:catalase
MEGHSVNTFKLINSEGKEVLCKLHCLPKGGGQCSFPLFSMYVLTAAL